MDNTNRAINNVFSAFDAFRRAVVKLWDAIVENIRRMVKEIAAMYKKKPKQKWYKGSGKRSKAIWYIKQLLPLKYHTKYREDGKLRVVIWRMFWGRSYDIEDYEIVEE